MTGTIREISQSDLPERFRDKEKPVKLLLLSVWDFIFYVAAAFSLGLLIAGLAVISEMK